MLEVREISPEEYGLVKDHLVHTFGLTNFEELLIPFKIFIVEGYWKELLLITDQMVKIFDDFKSYRKPYFMGIYFGDIKENHFKISLEGITFISEYVKEKTILTDFGEQRVLYGRDLTKQDVLSIPAQIKKNDFSIVINEKKEVLALGKYLFDEEDIHLLEKDGIILKNIIDKGWYLRKGK